MKKWILIVLCLGLMSGISAGEALAKDGKPIDVKELPQPARDFIGKYFQGKTVTLAKVEDEYVYKEYNVIFTDGTEVEFDRKGNWKEVGNKRGAVPSGIVPAEIRKQIEAKYPGTVVRRIERDRRGYELRLSDGWELEFDLAYRLVDAGRD